MDETRSEAEHEQESRGLGLGTIAWVACTFLVVYVLSVGPVAKIYHGNPPNKVVEAIYKPLTLLYNHSAVAKRCFDWYFEDVWGTK